MKGLRPGSRVVDTWPECYGRIGTVKPTPKNFPKHWSQYFAWVAWDNGSESGEMRRYLYRV